ncbi:MAG: allophanate hydrolase [Pseudomonadota bacterium]|nr:allophanate hydrolase [Pseudomonadota bacterium]
MVLDLAAVRAIYCAGSTPHDLLAAVAERMAAADPAIFIARAPNAMLAAAADALLARAPQPNSLPLWGVPFAVKDNIDVAGLPTTCACPEFAYRAWQDAEVVSRLRAAGAIPIGKTNLDQFATGLNGTRSPYGAPRSVFNADHISGGSSSGSAVAVAGGIASFALGTDTAGSGRVPAMFNNIVGVKPTPGLLSNRGMVPACESLDCISLFALSVADGAEVRRVAEGYDPVDPWSRRAEPKSLPGGSLRIGVPQPAQRDFHGHEGNAALYAQLLASLEQPPVEIDYTPFAETAALLYDGPWVAERQAAFNATGLSAAVLDPSVGAILAQSAKFSAVDLFDGQHQLQALRRRCMDELARVDVLLLPTAPRSFTVAEMRAEPIRHNSALGIYTNFCNLLGLSALAIPGGFAPDGMPFGVTLVGAAFADEALCALGDQLHRSAACGSGIARDAVLPPYRTPAVYADRIEIAVVGAHLSGMPLNRELLDLGGELVTATRTAPDYRLYALPKLSPPKPGLIRVPGSVGPGITLEIWSLPAEAFGRFVAAIGSPLGIGKISLADGGIVSGFLCENWAVQDARDITDLGGWREFLKAASVD